MRVLFLVIALQVIAPKFFLLFYSITIKKDEKQHVSTSAITFIIINI